MFTRLTVAASDTPKSELSPSEMVFKEVSATWDFETGCDDKTVFAKFKQKAEALASSAKVSVSWKTSGGHLLKRKVEVILTATGKLEDLASFKRVLLSWITSGNRG